MRVPSRAYTSVHLMWRPSGWMPASRFWAPCIGSVGLTSVSRGSVTGTISTLAQSTIEGVHSTTWYCQSPVPPVSPPGSWLATCCCSVISSPWTMKRRSSMGAGVCACSR